MNKILLPIVLIFLSCNTEKLKNSEKINSLYQEFIITSDYSYLDTIYSRISRGDENISEFNIEATSGAYIYLKKYSELDSILNLFETSDSSVLINKKMAHNIVKHLNRKAPDDNHHILKNITYYSELIRSNKMDSMAYAGLYINLIYLQGKEKTLNQIDSLEKMNDNFSSHFYEFYLRQAVSEYPDAFYKTDYEVGELNPGGLQSPNTKIKVSQRIESQ